MLRRRKPSHPDLSAIDILGPLMDFSIGAGASSEQLYTWAETHIPAYIADMAEPRRMAAAAMLRAWATNPDLTEDDLYRLIVVSDLVDVELPPDFEFRTLLRRIAAVMPG